MIGQVLNKYSPESHNPIDLHAPPSASDSVHNTSQEKDATSKMSDGTVETKPAKSLLKKRQATPEMSVDDEQATNFVCKECGDVFEHGQALGGHMSRKHPGQSAAFNKKILRRKEREFERELLHYAKEKHSKLYGSDKPIDRVKIRRFRKEMRKQFLTTGKIEI